MPKYIPGQFIVWLETAKPRSADVGIGIRGLEGQTAETTEGWKLLSKILHVWNQQNVIPSFESLREMNKGRRARNVETGAMGPTMSLHLPFICFIERQYSHMPKCAGLQAFNVSASLSVIEDSVEWEPIGRPGLAKSSQDAGTESIWKLFLRWLWHLPIPLLAIPLVGPWSVVLQKELWCWSGETNLPRATYEMRSSWWQIA